LFLFCFIVTRAKRERPRGEQKSMKTMAILSKTILDNATYFKRHITSNASSSSQIVMN
jgi:hypothetical protein